ncbi:MAG: PepSY domain-containing protein [Desmonostoc vinosum HA7617-LM4]|jgi:uncharacterized iron-regulated membrane protein|nr:PepSY domain-containing protein [Desmonostoc vinosum HA7617-LM4]
MNTKLLRNWIFTLHRYLGLAIALIVIMIGITGSLLVFHSEINAAELHHRIGAIAPQGQPLPVEAILEKVQAAYKNQPDVAIRRINLPTAANDTVRVTLKTKTDEWAQAYVNPYTGAVLGDSLSSQSMVEQFFKVVLELHYALLAGDLGVKLAGVVGLLMSILTITGVALWPGWRKLINGFKIKWNAHPKRVNFDVHKVVGIVAAVFLFLTFFTGFCWNLGEIARPIIYAFSFSPMSALEDATSTPAAGRTSIKLTDALLRKADAALPGFETTYIALPAESDQIKGAFMIRKRSSANNPSWDSSVFIDQYSGEVIRVDNGVKQPLGARIENSFATLHYGTFWGIPSRVLYVFVGLAPLILFVTGVVMYYHRRKIKTVMTSEEVTQ